MSTSYAACVILGFHLTESQRWKTARQRGCAHEITPNAQFCSECGRPSWFDDVQMLDIEHDRFTLMPNNTTDFQHSTDEGGAIVGLELSVDTRTGATRLPPQEDWANLEQHLLEVLALHDITPPGRFGLHLARYVS